VTTFARRRHVFVKPLRVYGVRDGVRDGGAFIGIYACVHGVYAAINKRCV